MKNPATALASSLRKKAEKLSFLLGTSAPPAVYFRALGTYLDRWRLKVKKQEMRIFREHAQANLRISNDWFTTNIPHWLLALEGRGFEAKELNVLEIGSWEGLSAHFICKSFPRAHLTCVDTWAGSDEHAGQEVLQVIESNFDFNLQPYAHRLTKFRGRSIDFFASAQSADKLYDLIYVDGSHYSDDVLVDALESFKRLRSGGVIIFEDYFWRFYDRNRDNPAGGANCFLLLKSGQCRIVQVYHQLIVEKL